MEKAFRYMCVLLSAIIILSSITMVFAVAGSGGKNSHDFFGCDDIIENIENTQLNMTSVIYVKGDDGGWEEYQRIHGTENRIWVDIEDIPQQLIDAFIAIEDQRFYKHFGVDWKRTTSAFVNYLPFVNLYSSNQGGSTITQQLIKNITSDKDTSATRKLREIARAMLIEAKLDKITILEAYLNTISLGNGICGVEVAANYYFNKEVGELTLAECASLAAITKNPSAYNPQYKPEGNKKRRADVLNKMLELNMIDEKQFESAYNAEVKIDTTQQQDFEIPINDYFVDTLISDIIEDFSQKYGCSTDTASTMLYNGGYKIYATLDTDIQDTMEKVYHNQKKYFPQKSSDKTKHVQSAMTIMDYEGNILGVVGGVGEKTVNRGLNRAIDSPRQPGSTMKPLGVYTLAIDNGHASYSTMIEDKPLNNYYGNGKKGPKEWYGYYAGNMTVKSALERSANTIPCWLLKDSVGVENSYKFLTEKLNLRHLTSVDKNISSLALGGCQYGITTTESAAAYAIFGNGGKYYEPTTYVKVTNALDEVVLERQGTGEQVIKPATATIMNKLLQNVVYGSQGTGKGIAGYNKMKVYAKTGTSSESNDLWMVAGTPYYVGSVWYGFDKPQAVHNGGAAATVWRTVMSEIHKELEEKEFAVSEDVIEAKYCNHTGLLAKPSCDSTSIGYYIPNVEIEVCGGNHPIEEENTSSEQTPSEDSSSEASSVTSSVESSSTESTSSESSEETIPSSDVPTSSDDTVTEPEENDGTSDNQNSSEDNSNISNDSDTSQSSNNPFDTIFEND